MRAFHILIPLIAGFAVIHQSRAQICLAEEEQKYGQSRYTPKPLYKGLTIFTSKFLEAMHKASPNENLFFSPYSLYQALLLTYLGSEKQTENGLKNVLNLHWAKDKYEVFQAYKSEKALRESIAARDEVSPVEFTSIDRFYFSNEVELNKCIEDLIVNDTRRLDFRQNSEAALKEINNFVNEATRGNIPSLLSPGDVSSSTQIVLANAAYFKGSWGSKFDAADTTKEIFYSSPVEMNFVEMMSKNATYNHAANEQLGCHVLEIPYEKSETSNVNMIIFLPPAVAENALEKVLNKITPESLQEALQDGFEREVQLKLPKFSTEKSIELLPVLKRMGAGEIFQSTSNLEGFSKTTKLQLDDAIQKAKITVDEEGSTAAAATSLFSFRSSRPAEPAIFHCNHPFLYMIYDQDSRAILFAGIYRGPEKN